MTKTVLFAIFLFSLFQLSNSQSPLELLEKAYKNNSSILLDSFFVNWQNEIKPISEEELTSKNDTIKAVYELFSRIYQPQNLEDISNIDYSNYSRNYSKVKYSVVQNSILFRFVDKFINPYDSSTYADTMPAFSKGIYEDASLDKVFYTDSIQNFRPYIKSTLKPVFLNDKYKEILITFLVGNIPSHPYNILEERKLIMDDIEKRFYFLNQMIEFTAPYYSGFTLITWPKVSMIDFTIDFLNVRIKYTINWDHWLMFLEKSVSEWSYLSHKHYGSKQ